MTVYSWVIVGTDGSATATQAVRRAAVLASGLSAPLLVAVAFKPTRPEDLGPPSVRAQMPGEGWAGTDYRAATATANEAAAIARQTASLVVETATPEGDPASALLDLAEARPGSLLVVGSQGMTASRRFLLGSVPNKVTHHAVGDVLVVRTGSEAESSPPTRIVVGTDGSKTAQRAVERAVEIAAPLGATVTMLSAGEDASRAREAVETAGAAADSARVAWRTDVRGGAAVDALLDAARSHDLAVVGNKGMTGAGRLLLGSVPNTVSHHITTDLLVVRTDAP